jgi:hypothetical protein
MRNNNEACRGGNLGQARECVRSAADTRKTSLDARLEQAFVLCELLSGHFVQAFDPDVHAPGIHYPTGFVHFTEERDLALHFKTLKEAAAFVRQPSKVTPLRPDGKPNRPLMFWSLIIEPVSSQPRRCA